ncbi:hypothetical protein GPECTOR_21g684 [Gonium pectorale]|uniref:SOUL heme-binding protein n=1 Tax=Gonium pectorale TaxID=33097 RepID=A0A150GI02_GONPE|nr:hypothetical protein GPECTOR_21g684 [Gonium pectorale]|eukprot:KXZ49458.1 hypothetical protein GPECTOR_21g684 [Gonium pectorale]
MSTIFGAISVETPKFSVIKALNLAGAEVRKYPAQVRAEVTYDIAPEASIADGLNTPFRALAGFIFGGNTSRAGGASEKVAMTAPVVMQTGAAEKIAMTAPVVMHTSPADASAGAATDTASAADTTAASGKRVMAFIMPSKYKTVDELPTPKDERVKLTEVPERTFAALRFRGVMTRDVVDARTAELRAAAEREGLKLSVDPSLVQYCAYNPPWCLPWLRTNDILIPVAE